MIKLTKKLDNWITNRCSQFYLQRNNNCKLIAINVVQKSHFDNPTKVLLIQAILDGEWEVEEPLYYVKLVNKGFGYLNQSTDDLRLHVSNKNKTDDWKTKFTRAEVEAIDPRYLEFLEEVE
ncbi:DUF1642 domain-containing protein [Streptococcus uberis]|uniref:DUF1642 domain-containing protein n=1 Tax=Streptococcus uberis TaxID=1349 RepID=UPI003D6BCE0A